MARSVAAGLHSQDDGMQKVAFDRLKSRWCGLNLQLHLYCLQAPDLFDITLVA